MLDCTLCLDCFGVHFYILYTCFVAEEGCQHWERFQPGTATGYARLVESSKIDLLFSDLWTEISSVWEELKHIIEPLQQKISCDDVPLLNQAHGTLQSKPKEEVLPWPFVISVCFFNLRNDIMHLAGGASRASPLLYHHKNRFCPDYTSSVTKKRAAFMDVIRQHIPVLFLVKFGLRFPVVLMITLPSRTIHSFPDVATAMGRQTLNL